MTQEEVFDAVVVGAGIAGSVCALQLARQGHEVVLLERGAEPGSKNLSGGVFYCRVMDEVFPDFARVAPVDRRITRNVVSFCNDGSWVNVDYWDSRLADPVSAVTVRRAVLDAWLVERCEEEGVMVMPGVRVDELVREGDQVVGVRAGEEELRARVVIAADGVNSFLSRDSGLREREPRNHLAVGVKSVIGLAPATIEERFHLRDGEGAAYAMVGDVTRGLGGGGFLYTNTESVSVGVVVRLDALEASGESSSGLHDHLLSHPLVSSLVEGGELLEYGCHLVAEGGQVMQHDLVRPGLMVIGDAAGFTLNTGLTVRGMDLAAQSAISAARAAHRALQTGELSEQAMAGYLEDYRSTFLGRDMTTYSAAPGFLENHRLYDTYGPLLADILHEVYHLDTTPRRHLVPTAVGVLRRRGPRATTLARDIASAARAL